MSNRLPNRYFPKIRLRKRLKVIMRRRKIYGEVSEVRLGVTGLKQPIGDKVSEKSSQSRTVADNSQNAFVVLRRSQQHPK